MKIGIILLGLLTFYETWIYTVSSAQTIDDPYVNSAKNPTLPQITNDTINDATSESTPKQIYRAQTIVNVQTARKLQGIIKFPLFSITTKATNNGYIFTDNIPIQNVSSIHIERWCAYRSSEELFFFKPCLYTITTVTKVTLIHEGNIPELNRIILITPLGQTAVFSYFMDYIKKKKWVNSGASQKEITLLNPIENVWTDIQIVTKKKK